MSDLRFAVATFARVFDTEPTRDIIGLEQLTAGLQRFLVKPKTQAQMQRAERQIEAAWQAWQASEHRAGKHWSRLARAQRDAEAAGSDVEHEVREAYLQLLSEARSAPKRDLRLWSPTLYAADSKRGSENVVHLSCLVLDYDSGIGARDASETWREFFHIVHTTWSHTPEHPKLRVVLPLAEPVAPSDWREVYEWAERRSGMTVDPTGKSIGTTFALPAVPSAETPRIAYSSPGPLLDARIEGLIEHAAGPPSTAAPQHRADEALPFRAPLADHEIVEGSSEDADDGSAEDDWTDGFPWS